MSAQTNKFKKAAAIAKRLYKTGRYKRYSDAMSAAFKKLGSGKTKTKRRKVSGAKKAIDKKRSRQPKSKIVIVGSAQTLGAAISNAKNIIANRIAHCEVAKFKASTKRAKRQYSKRIAAYKKQYNKLK